MHNVNRIELLKVRLDKAHALHKEHNIVCINNEAGENKPKWI